MNDNRRRAELAAIHVGQQKLGLDDATYRDLLWSVARVRSAADLDGNGRQAVIERMRKLGFERAPGELRVIGRKPSVPIDRLAMLNKVEALLAARTLPWTYASSIAKRMFKIDQLEWLTAAQLHTLIGVLEIDRRRRAAAHQKHQEPAR